MTRRCYLYKYVYPDGYNAMTKDEKDALTVSAEAYLAAMRSDLNVRIPIITKLRGFLRDTSLVSRAANVYVSAYPAPWRTMFGDPSWNVDAEPVRKSPLNTDIEPRIYAGKDGFIRMVAEILRTLDVFEASYETQESLLRDLDRELILHNLVTGQFSNVVIEKVKPSVTEYLRFNRFDEQMRVRRQHVLDQIDHPAVRITKLLALAGESQSAPAGPLPADSTRVLGDNLIDVGRRFPLSHVHPSVDEIVARINALQVSDAILLDRLYYLLTITEEAMSHASANGVEVGDLVSF